jgi:methylated-DNA-[protein]-cysteine S-methyltransferase
MVATTNGEAITALDFVNNTMHIENSNHPLLLQLENELLEYFAGQRTIFTLPLNPSGTPFQKSVWQTLCTIAYGETISYASEAKLFGNPKAVRAVANANGRNPISIVIPCHRVIATGGGLGGYSGGIAKKEFLLALEKKRVIL